jgi:TatD DNase family protein
VDWFDSHCHLDDELIPGGTTAALAAARDAGVSAFVAVGTDAARSSAAVDVAVANDDVWATVGLHPHDAVNGVDTVVDALQSLSSSELARVVAIGECGLDYHYDHSPRAVQRDVFAAQIALAREHERTLVIHTREAWDDTFDLLAVDDPPERVIVHCFTGGPTEARRALDLGAYLSFSGIVTFKKADDVRAAAALCPPDRLLVETDAPFLAPVPHRGRRNEPAYLPFVGATLATVRGVNVQQIADDTGANARVAFGLLSS